MPRDTDFVSKLLDIAACEVGVRETAPNRGQRVDEYHRYAGRDPAAADSWCAQFVGFCSGHAAEALDLPNPLPKASSVWGLWQRAPLSMRVADPRPGDVFLIDHGDGKGHCGIVTGQAFGEGMLTTCEGNTSVTGSRNGDGVYNRTRGIAEITIGFLRPALAFVDGPAVA
jgi:hypothetical protein